MLVESFEKFSSKEDKNWFLNDASNKLHIQSKFKLDKKIDIFNYPKKPTVLEKHLIDALLPLKKFFNLSVAKRTINEFGCADLITINHLFANVDDLYNFTESLQIMLSPKGVIVIETSYLMDLINNMVFDFIYHEHLSCFSIIPLTLFFRNLE